MPDPVPEDVFKRKFAIERAAREAAIPAGGFTKIPTIMGAAPVPPKREIEAPTRKTSQQKRFEIEALLEKHNIHPIEEMILMLRGKTGVKNPDGSTVQLGVDQRIKLLSTLADYVVPKVKAIEVSGSVDHTLTVNILKFADVQQYSDNRTVIAGRVEAAVQPLPQSAANSNPVPGVDDVVEVEILREA